VYSFSEGGGGLKGTVEKTSRHQCEMLQHLAAEYPVPLDLWNARNREDKGSGKKLIRVDLIILKLHRPYRARNGPRPTA